MIAGERCERERLNDFPVCLQLSGRPVLVVGAGPVAARRILSLLRAKAAVTVVAPTACRDIVERARAGELVWHERDYLSSDVVGMRVVFAATDDRLVNRLIARDAAAAGALVNVSDDPAWCDFTMPAVHHHDVLCLAVSSYGIDPARAGKVRDELARYLAEREDR